MGKKLLAVFAAAVGLVMVPGEMFAHHGTSEYDMKNLTTVKGTVTEFAMINPHVMIYFDVTNDKGVVEHWSAETQGPIMLTRAGWTKKTLKPGDQITVSGQRHRNGSPRMRLEKLILPNGQELKQYPY